MLTNTHTLADIEFQLTWKSDAATHSDSYVAQRVNFYRDCFPKDIHSRLLNHAVGDQIEMDFKPGEIVPAFDPRQEYIIQTAQFDSNFDPDRVIIPRTGRFYRKGMLRDIPNVFRENIEPFRCVEVSGPKMRISLNHPLALFPIHLRATILAVREKPIDRGGTCIDWLETATKGPGMQIRAENRPTDFFSDQPFDRDDDRSDSLFYERPRFVNHLDDRAIDVIADIYGQHLRPGMNVLDLMSSWTSHLPESLELKELAGLGMNREELAANPRLNRFTVQDLNQYLTLPYESGSLDAVICTASVEYLTRPFEVFSEISRILKPGGICIMTFSNRWFPPKAIWIWKALHEYERLGLVMEYMRKAGSFEKFHTVSVRGLPRPETDKYFEKQRYSDPVYAVSGRKKNV